MYRNLKWQYLVWWHDKNMTFLYAICDVNLPLRDVHLKIWQFLRYLCGSNDNGNLIFGCNTNYWLLHFFENHKNCLGNNLMSSLLNMNWQKYYKIVISLIVIRMYVLLFWPCSQVSLNIIALNLQFSRINLKFYTPPHKNKIVD